MKIAIDIDEVLRAKWFQFDKYYIEEFGESGVPENEPYTHDFFKNYEWKGKTEVEKFLKEDCKFPENIDPIYYQSNENGEAPADPFLFKPEEKKKLTPKEVYNRFMYEDYVLEIHGTAPLVEKNLIVDIMKLMSKYKKHVEFVVVSKENWFSIPATLFFLSKTMCRFKNYVFVEEYSEYWKQDFDLIITANPDVIRIKPKSKKHLKIIRPYNTEIDNGVINNINQLTDLIDNVEFEKLINYYDEKNEK